VGCTLHYIDAGIDTGKLIAHVCPEIHGDEDELTLFWRAVQDSAEVYAKFIERVGNGERLVARPAVEGPALPGEAPAVVARAGAEQKLASGFLRQHVLPRRVTWFTDKSHSPAATETVHI